MTSIRGKNTKPELLVKKLLLAGCAPCQPFSNHKKNSKNDNRKSLMNYFGELIEKIRPEYVLVENVPGFRSTSNTNRKKFINMLEKNNYCYDEGVLNVADYEFHK